MSSKRIRAGSRLVLDGVPAHKQEHSQNFKNAKNQNADFPYHARFFYFYRQKEARSHKHKENREANASFPQTAIIQQINDRQKNRNGRNRYAQIAFPLFRSLLLPLLLHHIKIGQTYQRAQNKERRRKTGNYAPAGNQIDKIPGRIPKLTRSLSESI